MFDADFPNFVQKRIGLGNKLWTGEILKWSHIRWTIHELSIAEISKKSLSNNIYPVK